MYNIKISIIVPVYNVEKYIKRCLDSLIKQAWDSYEIIVVNDGCTDNSMEYVYKLQKTDTRIIICNRKNGGQSAARNTGLQCTRGEYIFFCDSDDEIKENCLKKIYEEAKSKDLDMLLFDGDCICDIERENKIINPYVRSNIGEEVMTGREMLSELLNKKGYSASPCLYLIKREVILRKNLQFYEGIIHEDELFTPIALLKSNRVVHKRWKIYIRHIRENSTMTGSGIVKKMQGLTTVISELMQFANTESKVKEEKKLLRSISIIHIKNFKAQMAQTKEHNKELLGEKQRISSLIKTNNIHLGLKFNIYLIYLYLKREKSK